MLQEHALHFFTAYYRFMMVLVSVPSRILTSANFAQTINSLKFLPKDFTTLKTPFTNFLH